MNKLLTSLLSSVTLMSGRMWTDEENYYVKHVEFPQSATLEQKNRYMAARLVPTPAIRVATNGIDCFPAFGINTFTDANGAMKRRSALFNLQSWMLNNGYVPSKGGFKMVLLTAKHHDGFCLWPTATTKHSVASSPWKNGQGDVVKNCVTLVTNMI